MPTLHALLIAINDYPNPAHRLNGCVNDLEQVQKCLETCCAALGLAFKPTVLLNEQATRTNVIDGFDHFGSAEPDDPCLFYYAGHGARSWAPEAFWHLEPDHKNDSLVCYDSRTPDGRDLMDKELSYLIWQANKGKNLPFVTVMDCCHSGSMRDLGAESANMAFRQIKETGAGIGADQYLGVEHYKRTEKGELSPPQGRRVHLAAARDVETAKEVRVGDGFKGIFSHFLAETLQQLGPTVAYHELLSRIQMRVRGNISDQSPQLWATQAADKALGFLSGAAASGKKAYFVGYDKNKGWQLNAGAVHGLKLEASGPIQLEIPALKRVVDLLETQPSYSKVGGMKEDDPKQTYAAFVVQQGAQKFKIAFVGPQTSPHAQALKERLLQHTSNWFSWADDPTHADFVIHSDADKLWLSLARETAPLFDPLENCKESDLPMFLAHLETICTWRRHLDWHNPYSQIASDAFDIELYSVTEPGNTTDDAPTVRLDWRNMPVAFEYNSKEGVLYRPAFQLKVRNTGERALWFSLLYFGCDYSITNALLPKQLLAKGEAVWASEVFEGHTYRTIPLEIGGNLMMRGIKQINEFFKIIISTEELDTDSLCQGGVSTAHAASHRQLGFRNETQLRDWRGIEIWIKIMA